MNFIGLCKTLYGKYLRVTNKTQKSALAVLNRTVDTGKYKCQECGFTTTNDLVFSDHLSIVHGLPKDMVFVPEISPKEVKSEKVSSVPIAKADRSYLDYL